MKSESNQTNQNTQRNSPRCEGIILKLCTHIFAGGNRCASPALRGEPHCYHHQPARLHLPTRKAARAAERRARRTFPIACPTNPLELQQTLSVILQAVAHDRITLRRAGRILAALQQLRNHLPETPSHNIHPAPKSPDTNHPHRSDSSRFGPHVEGFSSPFSQCLTNSITLKESEQFQQ